MDNQEHGRKPVAQQVRMLIVDPHASFRGACKAILQTEGLAVVADLDHCDSAEDVATALRPDVVLIDISPQD
jgi:DNA-binding NarL/FixJ family response regulator